MQQRLPGWIHKLSRAYWKLKKPRTLGARAIVLDETGQKVLLVEHTYISGFYLPGGGVNKFEAPEAAVARELREELGFTVTSCKLFGVYSNFSESKSDTVILLRCTGSITENVKSNEIASFGFFDMHALPENTSPGTRRRIQEYLNGKTGVIGQW